MTNNIDTIANEMLSLCLIDKFLWGFGVFSFFTISALFILLVVDAFECSRLNEDEDFNTTSGFEYLYGLAADALKGIKQWFLSLSNNRQEPSSPVSVNTFPEMPTPAPIPGNLRTKSCITVAHQKALEEEEAKQSGQASTPSNLRTKSCISEAHQKALEEEDVNATASMIAAEKELNLRARVAQRKVEMAKNFATTHPGPGTHHDWINIPFHSVGEQMASETEAYNAQNKTKTH